MFTLGTVFTLLIIHFLADFCFQTHWQATNKSSRWDALLAYTATYSWFWFFPMLVLLGLTTSIEAKESASLSLKFVFITFFWHTITDYITSREVKKLFDKQDIHNGFVIIG